MRTPPAWIPALVVVVLVAAGVALDRANPSAASSRPDPVLAGAAVSGAWYCAAGDTREDAALRVIVSSPPRDDPTPADVAVSTFREGVVDPPRDETVPPGRHRVLAVPAGLEDPGVAVRWWDAPAAVSRSAFVQPTGGPEGYLEGPCEPEPSPRWVFPGLATAGGAQARLTLANPFATDASVTVTFTTPEGPIEPKLLENVVVPKRSTRSVLLNEHAPERADLGVVVTARAGRVVAEAAQTVSAAIGGVDGVSLVRAAGAPAETWTVPWFQVGGEDVQSWMWVTNVEDRPAALVLTLHTAAGGVVPESFDELTVDPGETVRVDLRDLLPEGVTTAGATLRSENSVPVVASVATQYLGADPARTGLAVQLGATAPDASWVLAGGPTLGRDTRLHLVNPGAEQAVVDVALSSGGRAVSPAELQGVVVPPGALVSTDLTAHLPEEAPDHSVFVTAREGTVVAGRVGEDRGGTRRLVAAVGVPGALWAGGRVVPPVDHAPRLGQQLDTVSGPQPEDPLEVDVAPTETPTVPATMPSVPPTTPTPGAS